MKHFIQVIAFLFVTATIVSCDHSTVSQQQGKTLQLSSRTIDLSPTATTASVSANLSCGCPFRMESMRCWGDTDVIRFNLESLSSDRNNQQIVASVMQNRMGEANHYSACLSFVVNDRMMMTTCMDTVTVHYNR